MNTNPWWKRKSKRDAAELGSVWKLSLFPTISLTIDQQTYDRGRLAEVKTSIWVAVWEVDGGRVVVIWDSARKWHRFCFLIPARNVKFRFTIHGRRRFPLLEGNHSTRVRNLLANNSNRTLGAVLKICSLNSSQFISWKEKLASLHIK